MNGAIKSGSHRRVNVRRIRVRNFILWTKGLLMRWLLFLSLPLASSKYPLVSFLVLMRDRLYSFSFCHTQMIKRFPACISL